MDLLIDQALIGVARLTELQREVLTGAGVDLAALSIRRKGS
jgi:hypothetical protein